MRLIIGIRFFIANMGGESFLVMCFVSAIITTVSGSICNPGCFIGGCREYNIDEYYVRSCLYNPTHQHKMNLHAGVSSDASTFLFASFGCFALLVSVLHSSSSLCKPFALPASFLLSLLLSSTSVGIFLKAQAYVSATLHVGRQRFRSIINPKPEIFRMYRRYDSWFDAWRETFCGS